MSATPGARNEYSRGSEPSREGANLRRAGDSARFSGRSEGDPGGPGGGRRSGGRELIPRGAAAIIIAFGLVGALMMLVAEFTPLYQVHVSTSSKPVQSITGGSNHAYAIGLLGVVAAGLVLAVVRGGSRPALLAIGVIGVVALLIGLLGDLPDARAKGLEGSATTRYISASATPSAGLYLETLGSVLLIMTSGLGFLMLGPPPSSRPRRAGPQRPPDRAT